MQPYKTFSFHKIGISHIEKGLECEDYSLCYEDNNLAICAISDGHGDRNCFRSGVGAKIACESAVRQIKTFFSYGSETKSALNRNHDITLNQLEKSIISDWINTVKYDASIKPFSEEELKPLSKEIQNFYRNNASPHKAYGCTLIVSALTDFCWFVIQIGDGVCTAIFDDGVYINPVPSDNELCVGNRSASICSSDAIRSFRHFYGTILPKAIFVTSDGIEESFSKKDLNKCYYTISYWINTEDSESVKQHINELLPQISSGGSGDDVSLSIIIDPSYPAIQEKQSIAEINHKVKIYSQHLNFLKETVENEKSERIRLISENEKFYNRIEELQKEIEIMRLKVAENSKKLKSIKNSEDEYINAQQQFEKMINFKKSANSFWKNKNELLSLGIDEKEFTQNNKK